MKIVAINGSPRADGNTAFLLHTALRSCEEEGATTELIHIGKDILTAKTPFCVLCSAPCSRECFIGTPLERAYSALEECDGAIVGSPVYFGSATAQLKAFFDKSRYYRAKKAFVGKPFGAMATGFSRFGGQETTIRAIHDMLLVQGATIIGAGSMEYDAAHHGVASSKDAKEDEFAIQRAVSMGKRLVSELRRKSE